jgi:hypothetical protein
MTRQGTIEIRGEQVPVELFQQSKTVWVAKGTYMGEYHEAKDSTPGAALKRWKEAAYSRGGPDA